MDIRASEEHRRGNSRRQKKAPSQGPKDQGRKKSHEPKKTGLTSTQPESRHCRAESEAEQVGPAAPENKLGLRSSLVFSSPTPFRGSTLPVLAP